MGTAKPMPRLPACARSEMMAVLTPITSPRTLSSGPPELPGLIAASVWIIGCSRPGIGKNGRPIALTTPTVTVWPRLKGLPMAITQSPGDICSESPNLRRLQLELRLLGQLDQRAVGQRVAADDLRRVELVVGRVEEADLDLGGALDDVVVGEDEAGLVDDEAGARALGDVRRLLAAAAAAG